jgi:quinol monooxygenase YgiN
MVKHIIMWRLRDSAEGFSKAENAQRVKQQLEELGRRIQEIKYLEVGINVNTSQDAFDVVLYSEFENRDDLETYQTHPAHLAFKEFVGEIRTEKRLVDYEAEATRSD